MAAAALIYAKAGGPPDDWNQVRVVDAASGEPVDDVVEINAAEGWLIRVVRNADGHLKSMLDDDGEPCLAWERVTGAFRIVRSYLN